MRLIPVLALTLVVSACSGLLPKGAPAPQLFTLNPPQIVQTEQVTKLPFDLQILQPQAAPGLDTDRIALRSTDNRLDYYADTKWAGSVPALTQALLVESFEKTGVVRSVGNDLVAMNQNYNLLVEIRDFQSEYVVNTTSPRARVRLVAKLLKADTNEIIATNTYEETEIAGDNTLKQIIPAFDKALQKAISLLVQDTENKLGQQNITK